MSGADKCYYCSYTCDTKQGYYNDHGSCQSANPGKTCGMNAASGCYKAGGCDNAGGYYDTAAEINAKYPGYNAVLQNGCYVKGTPKSCPENQFVSGSCPPIDGKMFPRLPRRTTPATTAVTAVPIPVTPTAAGMIPC